jgi:hypothetical protein
MMHYALIAVPRISVLDLAGIVNTETGAIECGQLIEEFKEGDEDSDC